MAASKGAMGVPSFLLPSSAIVLARFVQSESIPCTRKLVPLGQPATAARAGEVRRRAGAERRAPNAGFTARCCCGVRSAWKWRTVARSERPALNPSPPPSFPTRGYS